MKKMLLALALLLAAVPAVADDATSSNVAVVVDHDAAAAFETTAETTAEITAEITEALELAAMLAEALPQSALDQVLDSRAYECPDYTIYCRRDVQCDGYCGAPTAGACVYGCCACYF